MKKPRYTLGIAAYAHDSSAAILRDGELLATAEEERFNRVKHSPAFPEAAIRFCLVRAGVGLGDVDEVVFFWNPTLEVTGNLRHFLSFFPATLGLLKGPSGGDLGFVARVRAMRAVGSELARRFGLPRAPRVRFLEHHLCHAASAFYPSPFPRAALLTIDGRGESTCTMLARADGNGIEKLREIPVPHSIGHFFAAVTAHLGFQPFFDEWKVMGMSAHGTDALVPAVREVARIGGEDLFRLDLSYFAFHTHGQRQWVSEKFCERFGLPRASGNAPTQADFDLARAAQLVVGDAGVALARHLRNLTGERFLGVSGGVALNCLMNRRLVAESGFEEIFFQPAAGDGGACIGAALYAYHDLFRGEDRRTLRDLYLGPDYSDDALEAALRAKLLSYRRSVDIVAEVAERLAAGKIVGWFQGRMEAGPRALGNRSILVDPSRAEMKDRLNALVKKREAFRPFAPAVPADRRAEFFDLPAGVESPFMMLIADVRPEMRDRLPAITHVDGTARVQTVSEKENPRFLALLRKFGELRGIPVLLNTSFNVNEPIVCRPEEAIDCYLNAGIDVLAVGEFLVER